MTIEKRVDESWKETVAREKEILSQPSQNPDSQKKSVPEEKIRQEQPVPSPDPALQSPVEDEPDIPDQAQDIGFLSYISSLAFQAMIFLGEIPNPMTNEIDKNLDQAKMLIDTLAMLREKTKGNLNTQENNFLSGSIYELQMKYVENVRKEGAL